MGVSDLSGLAHLACDLVVLEVLDPTQVQPLRGTPA
jgi:hypothetical protein